MIAPLTAPQTWPRARFTAALLKVASRCNLDCDYCYVYHHADQSWRRQPKLMAEATVRQFGARLDEYVGAHGLRHFSIIFHGGEPLLYGADGLQWLAEILRETVRLDCELEFSLQTNGVLLTSSALQTLELAGISISLSLDGPREVNDRHRLNHAGKSTFNLTMSALERLSAAAPGAFSGVIAVVDPAVSPRDLFEFFAPLSLPRLDLLLPDATHAAPPVGRSDGPGRYRRWLEEAFELWFLTYPHLPIRWFDAVLATRLGVPSPTDVMGFGNATLLVVETDGTYTDHDVFKITGNLGAELGASVFTAGLEEVAAHPKVREHGFRLTLGGLATECQTCPVVEACGGGCVMHRAHPKRGLDAPTVYCGEMFGLLGKATRLIRESIPLECPASDEGLPTSGVDLLQRCLEWRRQTEALADADALAHRIDRANASAAAILLSVTADRKLALAGDVPEPACHWLGSIRIQSCDPRLMEPFRDSIRSLAPDAPAVRHGVAVLGAVEACLRVLDPDLPAALAALISDILFVESTVPEESGIFSFSDDRAPNVLYVSSHAGGEPISADDLADSIYHEFRHQLLHHYERSGALLHDRMFPRFPAPWRSGLRPSGGFLHGTFVFVGLAHYWDALARESGGGRRAKARQNAVRMADQASYGIRALREFALLTPRGMRLVDELAREMAVATEPIQAPGVLVISSAQ